MNEMVGIEEVEDPAMVERVLSLTGAFMQAIAADPEIASGIPNGAILVLLPDNDPELRDYNMRRGIHAAGRGENVYLLHVKMADTHVSLPAMQRTA